MKQSGLAAVLLLISLALAQDGEWFTCLLVLVAWQVQLLSICSNTDKCVTMRLSLRSSTCVFVAEDKAVLEMFAVWYIGTSS